MLHTKNSVWQEGDLAGLTNPAAVDKELPGTRWEGAAYDARRSKFLAKNAGMDFAGRNVDNYVYFALWHYMKNRWDIDAISPPGEWKNYPTGHSAGYTDYRNGITTLPEDAYVAQINQTLIDNGGFVTYGGNDCDVDSDCDEFVYRTSSRPATVKSCAMVLLDYAWSLFHFMGSPSIHGFLVCFHNREMAKERDENARLSEE
ncbi:uncharacterized protein LTR77_008655 [Saxophila tyrrhenica]|uniref:Uncharacterized protein n=1 Tax=Saxophila tyrrhenica TaxID=1690608 RepID=A0AAV9P0N7_9PEZI|nr:hypothetical protein LTR77_008655 [Saxophila tyrrhenica]